MSWACEVIAKGWYWPFFGDHRKKMVKAEFERLSLSELPWLYTCAHYLTKESVLAEDLIKDTYLEAFRRFNTYGPSTKCRVWFLSILRNIFVQRYRKRLGKPEMIDWNKLHQDYESMVEREMKKEGGTHEAISISQFNHREVESAVKVLPEENRLAIVLVDIEELSYQEAARVMECSISRLRSRLSRGRRMLQVVLCNPVRPRDPVGEKLGIRGHVV